MSDIEIVQPGSPSHIKVAVFGKNQAGKSRVGASGNRPLFYDMEGSVPALVTDMGKEIGRISLPAGLSDEGLLEHFEETMRAFRAGRFGDRCGTFVPDSWTVIEAAIRAVGPKGTDPKDLGRLNDLMERYLRLFYGDLPADLVVTAHFSNEWATGTKNGPSGSRSDAFKKFEHVFDAIFLGEFNPANGERIWTVTKTRWPQLLPMGSKHKNLTMPQIRKIVGADGAVPRAAADPTLTLQGLASLYASLGRTEGFRDFLSSNAGCKTDDESLKALPLEERAKIRNMMQLLGAGERAQAEASSGTRAPHAAPAEASAPTVQAAAPETAKADQPPTTTSAPAMDPRLAELAKLHARAGYPEGKLSAWLKANGYPALPSALLASVPMVADIRVKLGAEELGLVSLIGQSGEVEVTGVRMVKAWQDAGSPDGKAATWLAKNNFISSPETPLSQSDKIRALVMLCNIAKSNRLAASAGGSPTATPATPAAATAAAEPQREAPPAAEPAPTATAPTAVAQPQVDKSPGASRLRTISMLRKSQKIEPDRFDALVLAASGNVTADLAALSSDQLGKLINMMSQETPVSA